MEIKEYFLEGKINNIKNEDGIFIGKNIIAVIDGVTSKTDNLYNGFKSGKVAKDILLQALEKVTDEMKMEETLNFLNSELKKYHDLHGKENEYFSAQIIMYNDYYKEIWNFGDCNCSINGKFHNHDKLYDRITSNARALYNSILLKNGYDTNQLLAHDLGSNYIEPLLVDQYLYDNDINSIYGYPILNGQEIHLEHAIKYSVKSGDEIIFASDVYPVIRKTLKESEDYLKDVLTSDPLCIHKFVNMKGLVPGNNSFDDRAYIRFIV